MFSKLKKGLKRAIVFILILGGITIIVITLTNLFGDRIFPHRTTNVWIDADSGRDIDDLFAISRLLITKDIEILGISSVQSELHPDARKNSMEYSQEIHRKLLIYFQKSYIPHPFGAAEMMSFSRPDDPKTSSAAEQIISKVKALSGREKLNIFCLGALTNVASAILMDPDIVPKIRVYAQVMKYEPKTKIWNKNDYNCRNDLDALDLVLNTENLELNLMTSTTGESLIFTKKEAEKFMSEKGREWDFLLQRWEYLHPGEDSISMKSVALVEAWLDQELIKKDNVLTPPENKQRTISVYTRLNKELMLADFFAKVHAFHEEKEKLPEN